jgi:hypothetical protein
MHEFVGWHVSKDVHEDVEIGVSLLLGPWTESKIKKLFWIVKAGARIDWLNSTSGEVSERLLNSFIFTLILYRWHSKVSKLQFAQETLQLYISWNGTACSTNLMSILYSGFSVTLGVIKLPLLIKF